MLLNEILSKVCARVSVAADGSIPADAEYRVALLAAVTITEFVPAV
jgi:hypothetical protein